MIPLFDLNRGPMFFPVTPYRGTGVNLDALGSHLDTGLTFSPAAVFIACGTGELHALSLDEYALVVSKAVETVARRVPVIAGTGGPLPIAQEMARLAMAAGCDGILTLPPYLVRGPMRGLVAYTRAVVTTTDLPAIVYNRPDAEYTAETAAEVAALPNVIGFKDGLGDLDLMSRIVTAVHDTFAADGRTAVFFDGLPTAELTIEAFRAIGVPAYSSAIFCFVPEVSRAFFDAVAAGDTERIRLIKQEFLIPFAELRSQLLGGAVALVKAGVELRGLATGGVRPPLADPDSSQLAVLKDLIERGLKIVAAPR